MATTNINIETSLFAFQVGIPLSGHIHYAVLPSLIAKDLVQNTDSLLPVGDSAQPFADITTEPNGDIGDVHQHVLTVCFDYINHTFLVVNITNNGAYNHTAHLIAGAVPSLQQVLDFNHDLVNGNNFQGTEAGSGNTGNDCSIFGKGAGIKNTGNDCSISGKGAGINNTGNDCNISGAGAGAYNTFNNVNLFGKNANATADGQTVLSSVTEKMARIDTTLLVTDQLYELGNRSGRLSTINVTDNYADDTDAGNAGVPVGNLYHTNGVVKVRLS